MITKCHCNARFLNISTPTLEVWTGEKWRAFPRADVMNDIMISTQIVRAIHRQKKLLVNLHLDAKKNGGVASKEASDEFMIKSQFEDAIMECLLGLPKKCVY